MQRNDTRSIDLIIILLTDNWNHHVGDLGPASGLCFGFKVGNIYHLTYSSEFDMMNKAATLSAVRALVDQHSCQIQERIGHQPRRRAYGLMVVAAYCLLFCCLLPTFAQHTFGINHLLFVVLLLRDFCCWLMSFFDFLYGLFACPCFAWMLASISSVVGVGKWLRQQYFTNCCLNI